MVLGQQMSLDHVRVRRDHWEGGLWAFCLRRVLLLLLWLWWHLSHHVQIRVLHLWLVIGLNIRTFIGEVTIRWFLLGLISLRLVRCPSMHVVILTAAVSLSELLLTTSIHFLRYSWKVTFGTSVITVALVGSSTLVFFLMLFLNHLLAVLET